MSQETIYILVGSLCAGFTLLVFIGIISEAIESHSKARKALPPPPPGVQQMFHEMDQGERKHLEVTDEHRYYDAESDRILSVKAKVEFEVED